MPDKKFISVLACAIFEINSSEVFLNWGLYSTLLSYMLYLILVDRIINPLPFTIIVDLSPSNTGNK